MSSEWTGPTPIAQEYPKGNVESNGLQRLVNLVAALRRDLRESTSNLLSRAGIRARPGYISSVDFDGTSRVALGTAGWMLGSNDAGPPYMVLAGRDVIADFDAKDVTILALIADLDAQDVALTAQQATLTNLIASVIYPDFGYANGSGYALPAGQASRVTRATISVPVPAGYTRALVTASAIDSGTNSTAGFDYLLSYVSISAGSYDYGYAPSATVPGGRSGASFASINRLLTGLVSGNSVIVESQPYTNIAAWAASASNGTMLSATCLFLR